MNKKKEELAKVIYFLLSGLFITSLVVSNLIFQKFFYWYPINLNILGNKLFELSVGILPYPITFLITDLANRKYGKIIAKRIVYLGFFTGILLTLFFSTNFDIGTIPDSVFIKIFSRKVLVNYLILYSSFLIALFLMWNIIPQNLNESLILLILGILVRALTNILCISRSAVQ